MVIDLPEQLIDQAEFLVRHTPSNAANVRRAVSAAYYALFHLLVRDAIVNWKHVDHRSRLARAFDHKRMKDASKGFLKEIGSLESFIRNAEIGDPEDDVRLKLSIVATAFVDLQEARHKADYHIGEPFEPMDAAVDIAQARLAFLSWAEVKDESLAQGYLYSLLFRDRS